MKKLEKIYEMWAEDGKIDTVNISGESANISHLHNKYFKMYVTENLRLKKLRADYAQMKQAKQDYYLGFFSKEDHDHWGWPPRQERAVLKQDLPQKIEADQDIVDLSLKIGLQEAVVEYLESIIKQINTRGYQLKTIVDWERFTTGAL